MQFIILDVKEPPPSLFLNDPKLYTQRLRHAGPCMYTCILAPCACEYACYSRMPVAGGKVLRVGR